MIRINYDFVAEEIRKNGKMMCLCDMFEWIGTLFTLVDV